MLIEFKYIVNEKDSIYVDHDIDFEALRKLIEIHMPSNATLCSVVNADTKEILYEW